MPDVRKHFGIKMDTKLLHDMDYHANVLCVFAINTLRPRQNGRRFADDIFKRIFLNENVRISIKISLKFAPKGPINNIPALVQIMAWRRSGDKPLSEPMMVSLLTHICVTRPQWVKKLRTPSTSMHGMLLVTIRWSAVFFWFNSRNIQSKIILHQFYYIVSWIILLWIMLQIPWGREHENMKSI